MDWRKLFGCKANQELSYFPPKLNDKVSIIQPPPEVFETGTTEWKSALVGQFLGSAPNFLSLQRVIDNLWNQASKGFSVQVIENGPWHILNKPLILIKWKPNLQKLNFDLSRLPLWIHLFNVPLELFNREGLSYIASALGVPISMDSVTASKTRLEFSKVCIEVGAKEEIPKTVEVVMANGQTTIIFVKVPWKKSVMIANQGTNSFEGIEPLQEPESDPSLPKEKSEHTRNFNPSPKVSDYELPNNILSPVQIASSSKSDPNNFSGEESSIIPQLSPNLVESVKGVTTTLEIPSNAKDNESVPILKRGRGMPLKAKSNTILKGSTNRFEILSTIDKNPPSIEIQVRKPRPAASGVANLIKELKFKKKEHTVKVQSSVNSEQGGGDFNIYLNPKESFDFELLGPYYFSDMKDFHDVLYDLQLCDHPYLGPSFTWSNKKKENYLARKLERVLINPLWSSSFQKSFVEFLAPGPSNHCMALVWLSKDIQTNHPKPFKFFNFWANHQNFLTGVQKSWQQATHGNPMHILFHKLKRLKPCLQYLNKDFYIDISARVKLKKAELENIQISTLSGISPIEKELNVQKEMFSIEEAENLFLKQKVIVKWIKEGDRCTNLFHSVIANKHKRDTIRVIINVQGQRLESFDDMAIEILDYFKAQLGTVDPGVQKPDLFFLKNMLNVNLSSDVISDLTKIITSEEIKEAIFNQGNEKSTSPDGFTPIFFKKTWNVVGDDIPNPSKVKDFRPISCCSVVYKIISKILVKRMTMLLPDIISLNQTAFVRGRTIIDNTLLAQELVKGYVRKNISPKCALKIDLQKAFDSFHWDFISAVLIAIGLPNIFISWIEACFKEAIYSISLNGSLIGYFKGHRGNTDSVVGILTVLNHFYSLSGLKLNVDKTKLFAADSSCFLSLLLIELTSYVHVFFGGDLIKRLLELESVGKIFVVPNLKVLYVIKNKDFIDLSESPTHSWGIKKLLKLRTEAIPILNAGVLKTKEIWEEIREKHIKVPWHKVVWFPLHIPKTSMITWMAIHDRLPTRARLSRMRIQTDELRVFCKEEIQTRNHLFTDCHFAKALWNSILQRTHLRKPHMSWETQLDWSCREWKGKSLISTVLRIAWNAYIYFIWEERNRRIFQNRNREMEQLLKNIKEQVRIQT
ncbi:hypothetical protein F3Y22_tig00003480pilonHSYRG00012 [Hibiscus syriacus]|uniref:Reverse transcriptase domain-containing protein n=1 Tax=Hibiscus syriacus TaxID=106335 RepID=A0A6A3CR11_HIBSY|nr:hypothetical protein F3Y22_tig00003480pilonHSYRG00012 [Hibiscus syriacus]